MERRWSQTRRTHWLLPISVQDPEGLRLDLARAGVDAHGASNVVAIGGLKATAMVDGLVFVPCYPELTDHARARVCDVVRAHCLSLAAEGIPFAHWSHEDEVALDVHMNPM